MARGKKRGGRPRVEGERYTNGDLTKAEKARRKAQRAQRERQEEDKNVSVGIEQRKKHLNIPESLAADKLAPIVAWRWSRMVVNGSPLIQEHHYRAAEALHRLHSQYLKAIQCPGVPKTPEGDRAKGTPSDIDGTTPEYVESCRRKIAEWNGIRHQLLIDGPLTLTAAQYIAIENREEIDLIGEFRAAMNTVHRMLIGSVGRKDAA